MEDTQQSFWDHLDELRRVIFRILGVALAFAVVAFIFRDELFAVVLAPKENCFITDRLLSRLASVFSGSAAESFDVPLINTGLAMQFVIHMKIAFAAGVVCASPYIIYQLFRFVSPALYADERRYAVRVVGGGYVMFIIGMAVSYFLIFPLTFRFLGTYQVSSDVANLISLESYVEVLVMMSVAMGIVFEMPVVAWLFARLGFLNDTFMRRYRRHAIVVILIVAAVITPTSDIFTLLAVSLPMWLLYEGSIHLVARTHPVSRQPE